MKSVLISIQPKWCGLIASGKKTVEVRKTKPKTNVPFKCYIYCTGSGCITFYDDECEHRLRCVHHGKVIGEFVCDEIYTINKDSCGWFYRKCNEVMGIMYAEEIEELYHCIPDDELKKYLGNYVGYAWHISNLKIYDKPKELGEFRKPCIDKEHYCPLCPLSTELLADVTEVNEYGHTCLHRVKRPPQSWCYVEGLGEYGQ